ncbi:hypothetical protein O3M35_003938 [Rhynocoris fuscipes]|uniref:Ribosomal protein S36 n=1 Tax=Rhynocoris fuscipes TaxID=488301 RepID=A0AAW1CHV1_9HEMI
MKLSNLIRSVQVLKPHVPLIKFRKGSRGQMETMVKNTNTTTFNRKQDQNIQVIEDFQLPRRFRRSLLGENEINAINSGGCL